MTHEKLDQPELALADYEHAIQLVPRFGRAHHNLGHVHSCLAADERAVADYDRALACAGEA